MASDDPATNGPFIVWQDYGYEGWAPTSYATLKEALEAHRYQSEFVITKRVEFDVVERDEPSVTP
jgi:hypothetical protein